MDQKKSILRTNSSVLSSMKWWPTNTNTTNADSKKPQGFGSSIAVQKLRESKWFNQDESRVLCAVIESGFIIETKEGQENDGWFGVVQCKTAKGKHFLVLCIWNAFYCLFSLYEGNLKNKNFVVAKYLEMFQRYFVDKYYFCVQKVN